jgi:hypothetical protein
MYSKPSSNVYSIIRVKVNANTYLARGEDFIIRGLLNAKYHAQNDTAV